MLNPGVIQHCRVFVLLGSYYPVLAGSVFRPQFMCSLWAVVNCYRIRSLLYSQFPLFSLGSTNLLSSSFRFPSTVQAFSLGLWYVVIVSVPFSIHSSFCSLWAVPTCYRVRSFFIHSSPTRPTKSSSPSYNCSVVLPTRT